MRRLIVIFVLLVLHANLLSQERPNRTMITNWKDVNIESKYGNPIRFQYKVERGNKRQSHMENRFEYHIYFRSKTEYKGKKSPIWISFDIEVPGRERNLSFAKTLRYDTLSHWNFWLSSTSVEIKVGAKGYIGTFTKEYEDKLSQEEIDCNEFINDLGKYTKEEFGSDVKSTAGWGFEFFGDMGADKIMKYNKTLGKFTKIMASKTFSVVSGLLESDGLGPNMNAFHDAFDDVRGHVFVLEKHLKEVEKRTQEANERNAKSKADAELSENFWDTPENSGTIITVYTEEEKKLIKSIQYSQKELDKNYKKMMIMLDAIKIERVVDPEDCRMKALDEFLVTYKYNIDVLMSMKTPKID